MERETPLALVLAGHVDHGKSSLLGRLLHELDLLPKGKAEELATLSARRGVPLEWSFVLDSFQAERDQAITLDTTRVRVKTPQRTLVVIDAPGHKELLKNMIGGASAAGAALLVLDAQAGAEEQTLRHAYLLKLLGVRTLVVAINKMDLVGYREKTFREREHEVGAALQRLGLAPRAIVPVSARDVLIRVATRVDDTAPDGDESVAEHEAAHRGERAEVVEGEKIMRTQRHARDFRGGDRSCRLWLERANVDAVPDRLHPHTDAARREPQRQLASGRERSCAEPKHLGVEYRGPFRRMIAMTRHFAALDHQWAIEHEARVVAGRHLRRIVVRPGAERCHARRAS